MHKHAAANNRCSHGTLMLPYADALGMTASILCLVHCLVLPVLLVALPTLSGGFLRDERAHYILAGFVLTFCLLGVLPGYLRHSKLPVLLLMICGLSLVLFATFVAQPMLGEGWELPIITVGNLLVVTAHYKNRKLLAC